MPIVVIAAGKVCAALAVLFFVVCMAKALDKVKVSGSQAGFVAVFFAVLAALAIVGIFG